MFCGAGILACAGVQVPESALERSCRWEQCCGLVFRVSGCSGASERCQGAGSCFRRTGGTPGSQAPPVPLLYQDKVMWGAKGPGAFILSVNESKGRTVGNGHFGAGSVSLVLTVCHRAVFFLLLRRACSCQQKSGQSSCVYLHGFLREGKKCSCVEKKLWKPGHLKASRFKKSS